jgi:hypothetical protein
MLTNAFNHQILGKIALSTGKDKMLKTWNLIKGRSAYVTNIKKEGTIVKWSPSGKFYALVADEGFLQGEFHDQGDTKWIVIRRLLCDHNDTPISRPGSGRPQGVIGVFSHY